MQLLLTRTFAILMGMALLASQADAQSLSPQQAREIAKEAYVYGFPLVDNYRIQHAYFVDKANPEFKAPWNEIHNEARVYTPEDTAIQSPNSDTPYSELGADLRAEPLVLTLPAVEPGRYFSAQFVDLYTYNFAYAGSRATGNGGGRFLLAGPNWHGKVPTGIQAVFRSETEFAFVLYRTQLFGPGDLDKVRQVQAGYKVQTLSHYLGRPAPKSAPAIDFPTPLTAAQERTSLDFFGLLNFVLRFAPVHPSEQALRQRFEQLGIVPGRKFDGQALSPEMRQAITDGMADAWRDLDALKERVNAREVRSADVFGNRETLKNNYLYRMAAAVFGIYGNSKEEAIYPSYHADAQGQALDGAAHRYTLHFAPGQLPPVRAFWSLTLYTLPSRALVANPLQRYLINSSMLSGLKRDADGGLTIYVQNEPPAADQQANWLPAPKGRFYGALRLYWPQPAAISGEWAAPLLQSADPAPALAADTQLVTPDNFPRAETDRYFTVAAKLDGMGKFRHDRVLRPIKQAVVRPNRDTLYSSALFDLDAGPVTITLPDAGGRFRSLQAINEDHYSLLVAYDAGRYTFTRQQAGTRYLLVGLRTLADPSDPKDLEQVHALQDATRVEQAAPGTFEAPHWDPVSLNKVRDALLQLGATLPDLKGAFGTRGEVDPVRHLIGSAMAWGGNPERDASYLNVTPHDNSGATVYRLEAKEVPVDAFWSISVYDADGHFIPNALGAYTLNSVTAKKGSDGSVRAQFGGCDGQIANCLPTAPGWNYMVRLYRPRPEALDGRWHFPEAVPMP